MPITRRPMTVVRRLGDQAGRVGEIDQPRIRGHLALDRRGLESDRQGPQTKGQPPGANCLLAENTQFEGASFVADPSGGATDPDGREDDVGSGQSVPQVAGDAHLNTWKRFQDLRYDVQPRRVDVVEDDLVDPQFRAPVQSPVDQWNPEPAATQDHQSHAVSVSAQPSATGRPGRSEREDPYRRPGGEPGDVLHRVGVEDAVLVVDDVAQVWRHHHVGQRAEGVVEG